jgi:hypothetical protein
MGDAYLLLAADDAGLGAEQHRHHREGQKQQEHL